MKVFFQKTKINLFILISVCVLIGLLYHQFHYGFIFECYKIQGVAKKDKNNMGFSLGRDKVGSNLSEETFRIGFAHAMGRLKLDQAIAKNQTPIYEKPKKVKRIFVVTTWRAGSTFLGELIHSSPGIFYSYEPVHYLQFHEPKLSMKPMQLIRSVFSCSFTLEYLLHVTKRTKGGQFFLNMNRAIWEACKSTDDDLCIKPQFVQEICSHFPIQLVKEVRLSLTEVMADGMIDSNDPDLAGDWKVVYLVRDPRAIMSSRTNLTWCRPDPKCSQVANLCGTMMKDLNLLDSLKARQPDRYYLLKYEDLSLNLEVETEKLFNFLGLEVSPAVRIFLETHTKKIIGANDPHSIYRNPNMTVLGWRSKLSFGNVSIIEKTCSSVMKKLNYTPSQ